MEGVLTQIIIYHPSRYLGGTEILFLRVIELLLMRGYDNICVVDYHDGIIASKLKLSDVTVYDILNIEDINFSDNSILVSSARNISRVVQFCVKNKIKKIKPLFWLLHPSELYSGYIIGSTRIKKKYGYAFLKKVLRMLPGFGPLRKNIIYLCQNKNLIIMDESCLAESSWVFDLKIDHSVILPLITNLESIVISDSVSHVNQYTTSNLLIISRLDDFKIYGIYKLLLDLEKFEQVGRQFNVHLVGDGEFRDATLNMCRKIKNINFVFHGYVENNMLSELFANNKYDLCFAMGTAALEGASRGIPTVLLPATDKEITNRNDVYKYIGEEDSISLAEYLDTPFEVGNNKTLEDIIISNDKEHLSKIAHVEKFFSENYSKSSTCNNFLSALSQAKSINTKDFDVSFFAKCYIKLIDAKRCKSGV